MILILNIIKLIVKVNAEFLCFFKILEVSYCLWGKFSSYWIWKEMITKRAGHLIKTQYYWTTQPIAEKENLIRKVMLYDKRRSKDDMYFETQMHISKTNVEQSLSRVGSAKRTIPWNPTEQLEPHQKRPSTNACGWAWTEAEMTTTTKEKEITGPSEHDPGDIFRSDTHFREHINTVTAVKERKFIKQ